MLPPASRGAPLGGARPYRREETQMTRRHSLVWSASAVGALHAAAAAQMTIHLTFDSSVTILPNSAQIQNACNFVATKLQNNYSNHITINIRVVAAAGTSILGQSTTLIIGPFTYGQVRNLLSTAS